MPTTNRTTQVQTRLHRDDIERFRQIAATKATTNADLLREAVRFYLDNYEQSKGNERDSKLEIRLKKMEDRIAGLMARLSIDVGVIYDLIWRNLDAEDKDKVWGDAYKQSVKRLQKKIRGVEAEVRDLMKQ